MAFDLDLAVEVGKEVLRVEQILPTDVTDHSGEVVNNRKILATIYGKDTKSGTDVSFGQVLQNLDGSVLVVIRGTSDAAEWKDDAEFPFVHYMNGRIEHGFLAVYFSLRVGGLWLARWLTNQSPRITIAGHSLGGALVTLSAADVARNSGGKNQPLVYTFASPRVGDDEFAKYYESLGIETHRIFMKNDIVPDLPARLPLFPYQHVGNPYEVIPCEHWDVKCRHHLQDYLHVLTNGEVPVYPGC